MREILFRGKTFDEEWEEGSLHIEYGETTADGKRNLDYRILGMRGECRYVAPNTVGQYTGLTDKNGKKIFEGDRIEIRGYVYYCCWDEGNLEYILINEKESLGMGYAASSRMTVIGNVHDNPRLWEADDGS